MSTLKRTPQIRARITQVARMRYETPTDKELAEETGLSPLYIAQLISEELRNLRNVTVHVEHGDAKMPTPGGAA